MGRVRAISAAMIALMLLAGCEKAGTPWAETRAPLPGIGDRVKVLNGDVLVVDDVSIRLANAFAPQPVPYARCWGEALAAREVTREVRALVAEATDIQLRPIGQRDEFNRQVAYVTLGGLDLGDTLYEMGVASRPMKPPFRWCEGLSVRPEGSPKLKFDFSR